MRERARERESKQHLLQHQEGSFEVKAQVCGSIDELAILLSSQLPLHFVEEANSDVTDVIGEGGSSSGKERRKQEPYMTNHYQFNT